MIDKNLLKLGFASSNIGLMEAVEAEVREKNPSWDDKKVFDEVQKVLKKATLYNDKNKKPKKSKVKKDKK